MLRSEQGFTLIELLITMAIVGILLTGIYDLAISSSRIYLAQNAIVEMQADTRAAMDFLVRELRQTFNTPAISTTTAANDTITFYRVEDTGYSSGGDARTLNDSRKAWHSEDFAPTTSSSYKVRIVSGTGNGQERTIGSNSSIQLTISLDSLDWNPPPASTSIYVITSNKQFTRTSASDNILRYRIGATGNRNPLAENITEHFFSQPDPTDPFRITVKLKGQTRMPDPITKKYRYYELTEDVTIRNK